ncbi:MAG: isopenicillin epimerase, partial [Cyanobacteriota bacterium]
QPAYQAILDLYSDLEKNGPFSITANQQIQQLNAQLRATLADVFAVDASTITLTDNVTTGCDIVLWGIHWQAGDDILLTDCEHPGIIAIVQAISERFGVTYRFCPILETLNRGDPNQVIQAYLTPKTRLVILSHLLWNTGQVLPLDNIMATCRAYQGDYPVQVLVDGAQSAGSLPLNFAELGVDYYAFTGHKWFCGPAGVGGLYIHPDRLGELQPTYVGWRSINYGAKGEPQGWVAGGKRFEVATSAYPHYAGLNAALKLHQQQGEAEERYQQICAVSRYLWEGLQRLPHIRCLAHLPPAAGLVSFTVKSDLPHKMIVQHLEDQRFYLRTIADPDCMRACCHYFTTTGEVDALLAALKQFA